MQVCVCISLRILFRLMFSPNIVVNIKTTIGKLELCSNLERKFPWIMEEKHTKNQKKKHLEKKFWRKRHTALVWNHEKEG